MKKAKEPSLLKKIIMIHAEQAKRRKALRYLSKQSWSIDFLSVLLVKAAKLNSNNVELVITNKDGMSISMKYSEINNQVVEQLDDSILNHLDDDAALQQFIVQNSTR